MKLLCIIDYLGSGGAQRQLVELAKLFKLNGHDVSFLTYHDIPNFHNKELSGCDISVTCVGHHSYWRRVLKIRKYITRYKPDAVLSFLVSPSVISELAGFPFRKWKLVVGERSANPNMLQSPKHWALKTMHLLADYVVANSHENIKMVQRIAPLLPSSRCRVIYNVVDMTRWQPNEEHTIRKDGVFNLTVVASHQYGKNLNGLVEAVHLLNNEDRKLLIINWYGDKQNNNSYNDAITKIKEYGIESNFRFFDATNDIHLRVREADAVGLFSFYEGLPNAVCEGMACGKPIIASRVSDVPLLLDDEAYLFDPTQPKDIAAALILLIHRSDGELKSVGIRNRKRAIQLFDKNHIYNEYLNLLSNG